MLDPGKNPEAHPVTDPQAQPESAPGAGSQAAPSDPSERRRRALKKSTGDMVRSLLVVLGIVLVVFLAVPRPNSLPQRSVDVELAASGAVTALGFVPAVPRDLPTGWTATSADVRDSGDGIMTWHLGYLTADGHHASVEQAATVTGRWEEILTSGGTPQEPRTIDGTTWEQRYKDVREVHTLIHRGQGRTTLVTSKGGGLENAAVLARSIPVTLR